MEPGEIHPTDLEPLCEKVSASTAALDQTVTRAAAIVSPTCFKLKRTRHRGIYTSGGVYVVPYRDDAGTKQVGEFVALADAKRFRTETRVAEKMRRVASRSGVGRRRTTALEVERLVSHRSGGGSPGRLWRLVGLDYHVHPAGVLSEDDPEESLRPAAVLITAASTRRRLTTSTCPRGLEAVLGAGTGFLGACRSYDTSTHPQFAAPICVCQEDIARPSSARSLSGLARSGGECIRCDDSLTPPKPLSLPGVNDPGLLEPWR